MEPAAIIFYHLEHLKNILLSLTTVSIKNLNCQYKSSTRASPTALKKNILPTYEAAYDRLFGTLSRIHRACLKIGKHIS